MEGVGRKIQWSVPPQFKNILFYILNLWYHCNFKQVLYTMLITLAECGSAGFTHLCEEYREPSGIWKCFLTMFSFTAKREKQEPRTPKSFFKCVREFESRILL